MDLFKKLFENSGINLADVEKIIDNSEKLKETAEAISKDDASAVVVLCLALAKICAKTNIPVQGMIDSILEMENIYCNITTKEHADGLDN